MRVIRFRAKDVFTGKWVIGDLVHNQKITETGLEPRVMVGGYEVKEETIGQYTGFQDKNGKGIYEGDIVEMYRTPEHRRKSVLTRHIVKCDSVCSWTFKSMTKEILPLCMGGWISFHSYQLEVLGNIYDNPELVKNVSLNLPAPKPRRKSSLQLEFVVKDNPKAGPYVERTDGRSAKIVFEVSQKEMNESIKKMINENKQ